MTPLLFLALAGCPPFIWKGTHDCNTLGDCDTDSDTFGDIDPYETMPEGDGLAGLWGQIVYREYVGDY